MLFRYRLHIRKLCFFLRFSKRLFFSSSKLLDISHFTHSFNFHLIFLPEFLCTVKLVSVIQVINRDSQPCHHYWRQSKGNMDWAAVVIQTKHLFPFLCQNYRHDCCKYNNNNNNNNLK